MSEPTAPKDTSGGRASSPEVGRHGDMLGRVGGGVRYTDDIQLPGMLHAKIVRCPHPHARILSIDASEALAMPGVHGVITGKDMPIKFGIIPWTPDEYPLALDVARFVGDGVAAVAATDERTALDASRKIKIEYEVCRSSPIPMRPWLAPRLG